MAVQAEVSYNATYVLKTATTDSRETGALNAATMLAMKSMSCLAVYTTDDTSSDAVLKVQGAAES